ncbi:hypothetical protein Zmor_006303 [Zophobas morio]|uniref:Zinc finger PHD-type domain-containing protein n=2 Tax=Zophobas morio TaxID=2755281 RepID=A0AA38ITJ4_9CUCU|nr:hypothetical protein Zmor_006303 [Zophobas morio]
MNLCTCCGKSAEPHKIVNCCICSKSYKIDCVDVTNTEARKIHQKSGLSWTCKMCAQLGNDINGLKAAIVALQDEIKILKTQVSTPVQSTTFSLIETEKIVNEVSERERRKNNVIIYGCTEGKCKTNAEQLNVDTVFVKDMLSSLGINDTDNLKISRLGKFDATKDDRRRPIRVTLHSENSVMLVLRASKQLKTSNNWKNIYLSKDRTPMQLEIHRNIRNELHQRLANGESNLRINYKNGIPNIVSSLN